MQAGTKVVLEGFAGVVIEVCGWDINMVVVRLASGDTCVSKSTFDGRYQGCYIV